MPSNSLLRRCLSQFKSKPHTTDPEKDASSRNFHSSPSLSFSGLSTGTKAAKEKQRVKLDELPHELLLDILKELDKKDIYGLRTVNRLFRDITSDSIFRRLRLRLSPPAHYSYCVEHGWNNARDHTCGSSHGYQYPLTVDHLCHLEPRYFGAVSNSKRKTDRAERWRKDPTIAPICAMLNSDAPTVLLGSLREMLISLPAQWARISDSGFSTTLLYFADHVFPRMFKRMGNLKALHVQAHLYYETVDIVLHFLRTVCRLCAQMDIDIHVRLVYGYPATEFQELSGFCIPSKCIGALSGLASLTFQAHGGCDEDFKSEAIALINRSPRMDQDPNNMKGSFYEGEKLTLCNIGTRDFGWAWDQWGREYAPVRLYQEMYSPL